MNSGDSFQLEPSPKNTYRTMAVAAVLISLLFGVAIYSLSKMSNPPTVQTTAENLPLPVITATLRQDLPHFEYSDQGKALRPENFEGHWTLLTFWASWCEPCLDEMPALDQLSQSWQGPEFQILTVNVDDPSSPNMETAKEFLSDENLALATLWDRSGVLKKAFAVEELPRHFLINPQMKIVWQARGAFAWTDPKARDQLMKVMEEATEQTEIKESPEPQELQPPSAPTPPAPAK